VWIERQGIRDRDARLTALGERLTRYGLDLNRLERNPTSQYPYRLDELMQERAA
jgi:hypothetical protein